MRPPRLHHVLPAFVLTCSAVVAQGLALAQPVDEAVYRRLNKDFVERHALPRYEALASATADLAMVAEGCDLDGLVPAYNAAMDAWMSVQQVAVGPVQLMMRQPRLQFWPDSRSTGARQLDQLLADRPAGITSDSLAEGSVALQGFPALERLLFVEGEDGLDDFECVLVAAIATNMAAIGREVVDEWTGPEGEAAMIAAAGTDASYYASAHAVSADIYQGMYEQLQAIVDLKLGRPLGESADRPQPRRAESWRSARSLRNIALNLEGLLDLFAGGDGFGYEDALVEAGFDDPAARIRGALEQAIAVAGTIPVPLYVAVTEPEARAAVEAIRAHVDNAREFVAAEMGTALGLQVGFNSLDGD